MKINFIISAIQSVLILLITATDSQSSAKSLLPPQSVGAVGTEKPLYQQTGKRTGNSCYVYSQYVVKTVA